MRKPVLIFLIVLAIAIILGLLFYNNRKDHQGDLILYGNVDVRQVNLSFRVPGRVISMPFEEGDLVKQGDLVGEIDSQPYLDQVRQGQAAVESARINLLNAQKLLDRRLSLKGDGSVSEEDYENALTSRDMLAASLKESVASLGVNETNIRDTKVFAPIDGTILTRIREPGSQVKEADPIYTLSILSPVWIRAFVSEPDLGNIFPGMKAEITTDSGRSYEGHIGFISPVAEFTPKSVETSKLRVDLVYRLRITANNPDHFLKQGMPVTVRLIHDTEK